MAGHRMGFIPCLLAVAELGAVAATAGTLAAVVGPLALALGKMAGEDTDFGRAMRVVLDVTDKVSIVSAVSAGIEGLIADGIPAAWDEGVSRWAELLNSPLSAAGFGSTTSQQLGSALHWVEKEGSLALPPELTTKLAPQVLDGVAKSQKLLETAHAPDTLLADVKKLEQQSGEAMKKAYQDVKDETKKWLNANKDVPGFMPPGIDVDKFADAKATAFFNALIAAPPPPPPPPQEQQASTATDWQATQTFQAAKGVHAPRTIGPTPGQAAAQAISHAHAQALSPMTQAEVDAAEHAREQLRTVPIVTKVPTGWDPIFALGCKQLTGQCP
jgi:hypothetical protein